jgi:hypothetical protein
MREFAIGGARVSELRYVLGLTPASPGGNMK